MKTILMRCFLLLLSVLLSALPSMLLTRPSHAQVVLANGVFGTGGGSTEGGGIRIVSTLGQPAVGPTSEAVKLHGAGFWYQVDAEDEQATPIEEFESVEGERPGEYRLEQNYPNPFNPSTTIRFDVPETAHVRLTIHNMLGQEVRLLVDEKFSPGVYRTTWNARDGNGSPVASGLYLYRIETTSVTLTRRLVLLK